MSGDIQTGRTEVDNFNGHPVRLAGDFPVHSIVGRAI